MERDLGAQLVWLTQHARNHGYNDLHGLLAHAPHVYTQLAEAWRQQHPLPVAA